MVEKLLIVLYQLVILRNFLYPITVGTFFLGWFPNPRWGRKPFRRLPSPSCSNKTSEFPSDSHFPIFPDRFPDPHIGVSKNRGTPKWMVYNGKTLLKWMIWGYHHFRKHPHGTFDFQSLLPNPVFKRISWI